MSSIRPRRDCGIGLASALAKSLDFQDDPVGGVLTNAQDPARQIFLGGPQVNERGLAFVVHFALETGEFREPFPIFADLRIA